MKQGEVAITDILLDEVSPGITDTSDPDTNQLKVLWSSLNADQHLVEGLFCFCL